MVNLHLDKKLQNKLICFILVYLVIFFLCLLKLKNFNFTFYDTGYYFQFLNNIKTNYKIIINNNARFFFYPISYLLNLFSEKIIFAFLIFISLTPIFFLKKKLSLFAYFFLPTLWFTNLNGINLDVFSLPILAYLMTLIDKQFDYRHYFLFFLLISIKFLFILLVIGFLIFGLINKKIYFNRFFFIFLITLIIYFLFFFFKVININDLNHLISTDQHKKYFTIKKLITFISFFTSTLFLNFKNKKFFIFTPYFLFLFLTGSENYFVFYYHYLMPIYLILIMINDNNDLTFKKINYKVAYFILVLNHILISPSPISILFNFKIKSMYYKNNYFGERNLLMDKKLDELKNTRILMTNIFLGSKIYKNNNKVSIFYNNKNINDFEYFIFSKKNILFYGDQKCIEQDLKCQINDPIKKKITGIENSVKKISSIFYQDKLIIIYRNNKFNM